MQKAIEVLMGEHRLIEAVLGSLETYAAGIRAGEAPLHEVIGEYASFLRGFADTCHHGKEEDILFLRMAERGFSREQGPLAVMYHEHELGRAHVQGMLDLAQSAEPGNRASVLLLEHADAYVPLMRQHILKEDNVLYPLALQVLTAPELDAMNVQFEAFEAGLHADGSYDRLRDLAGRLTARFRPDAAPAAAAGAVFCCR